MDPLEWNKVEINYVAGQPQVWFPASRVLICHPGKTSTRRFDEANVVINLEGRVVKYRHGTVTPA